MKSKVIKKSTLFPKICTDGTEKISFKVSNDNIKQTIYNKTYENIKESFFKHFADIFTKAFAKGCKIIEQRCKHIEEKYKKFI